MRPLAYVVIVLAACAGVANAQSSSVTLSPDQQRLVLEEALALYDEGVELRARESAEAAGKFLESADRFQLLINAGVVNGELFYNLANAQLQAGQLGTAVANYRRAQRLAPSEDRIASNLEFARSQVESRIPESQTRAIVTAIMEIADVVPWPARLGGAVGLYVLVWMLLCVRVYRPRLVPRSLVAFFAAGAVLLGITVAGPAWLDRMRHEGVIVADEVTVRMGNGEGYQPQFAEPIREGVEFSVLERRGEWLEIELPNGGRGWIRADQAELL